MRLTPQNVPAFWDDMKPGIEKACEASFHEVSVETIWKYISSGVWTVWIASEGDEMVGLAIGEMITTENGWWLNLPFAWVDHSMKTVNRLLDTIEKFAKDNNALGVKFISASPKFMALRRRGYAPRYTEYVREEQ